jgi:hypothetical protein
MPTENQDNPYRKPETSSTPSPQTGRSPAPLAILGIVIVTIIAAACTFVCSCLGLGLFGYEIGMRAVSEFLVVVCILMAVLAGALTAWAMSRIMKPTGRLSETPPNQEDHKP